MPPSLFDPPPPLTPLQRKLLWIAAVAVVATRLFAMASSPWDWDEVQFMAGVREYDVGRHHPHPAGFPLYILLANAVQLFGASDFRSLQVVSLLAACSLFPIAFFLGRELRLSFRTSMLAALLFVFFPNVWYFGGTVFSDVTGTAINLAAVLALLRSCRGEAAGSGQRTAGGGSGRDDAAANGSTAHRPPPAARWFLLGCFLVGLALAVRPHGGFILLPPLLLATWYQRRAWRRIVAGAIITASIAIAAYLGAAMASESIAVYIDRVQFFQDWVSRTDSFRNPHRTPLPELADDFLVRPMGAGRLSMIVTALSGLALVIAAIRRDAGPWVTFATFAPYMVFAWLMHDPVGYHRYATAYVAMYALLAAYALEHLTAPLRRLGAIAHVAVLALIIIRYAWWTYPALREVRSTISPTHAAATFVQRAVPKGGRVWVDDSMPPWGTYYLADRRVQEVKGPSDIGIGGGHGDEYFLTEGPMSEPEARVFARPRGRVAEIHPPRQFEASVAPVSSLWRFGEGWSDPEGHGELNWRWMGRRSITLIPAPAGKAKLTLVLGTPHEIESDVEVKVNGATVERFRMPKHRVHKEWIVEGRAGAPATLEITTSQVMNLQKLGLGTDPRDLGLQLFEYRWQPLR